MATASDHGAAATDIRMTAAATTDIRKATAAATTSGIRSTFPRVHPSSLKQLAGFLRRQTFTAGTTAITLLSDFTAAAIEALNGTGRSILGSRCTLTLNPVHAGSAFSRT
jgi:hypothetical protein